jgi:hypothetical protein
MSVSQLSFPIFGHSAEAPGNVPVSPSAFSHPFKPVGIKSLTHPDFLVASRIHSLASDVEYEVIAWRLLRSPQSCNAKQARLTKSR